MGEEWSLGGGQFIAGRIVMLWRWPVYWRENGYVTEVANLKEGKWSCYRGGQREHGHVTEEVSIIEGEWSCYGGGQFK